ncbi:MAG: protocatechuate 3,4-dioxygenase [Burkholderiales bacterium]|nr:protocatechuate 3,4-dioxygenase [Nitrosomonas sp.]MCP5274199.1 protocatechuate 3,4-dioxygenase [Burkholderiales bacterium]
MKTMSRRSLLKFGVLGTVSGMFNTTESWGRVVAKPTPQEVEGPFYPVIDQEDKDADMTRVTGQNGLAKGQHIVISGFIKDDNGHPIENARIDIWQANAAGRYNHPKDPNPVPRDPYFQGWAIIRSDKNGQYRFKTVKPGAYPASKTWIRPPHIHFKVFKSGFSELVTQMYFPNEPLNESDLLFNNKNKSEQIAMIAQQAGADDGLMVFSYNIVLSRY